MTSKLNLDERTLHVDDDNKKKFKTKPNLLQVVYGIFDAKWKDTIKEVDDALVQTKATPPPALQGRNRDE